MRPVRLSVTLQETGSGWAARVTREDGAANYGFNQTHDDALEAISFAAGTVMRELSEALHEPSGGEAA